MASSLAATGDHGEVFEPVIADDDDDDGGGDAVGEVVSVSGGYDGGGREVHRLRCGVM